MDVSAINNASSLEWSILIPQLGVGGIFFLSFMFLLKWFLKSHEKLLDSSKEERANYQTAIQGFLKSLEQINILSNEYHKQTTEAHNYQRTEHEKIIDGLNTVISNSKSQGECLEKIKSNLDEQGKVLVRINGYKHD